MIKMKKNYYIYNMRRNWLLPASLLLLLGSCTDEQLVEEKHQIEEIIEPTTPQKVVLKVNSPSVVANVTTRGTGAVGDIENEETQSLWHNDTLHIFAINKYASDLTKELTGREDYNIPTFLMGNLEGQGVIGTAPDSLNIGLVKDWQAEDKPLYYPLNGAYNFFGFHTDDAHLSQQPYLSEDNSTMKFDVTFNGTQDIMIAKAELTDADKRALIESMIKNGSAGLVGEVEDYYDFEQHKLISDPDGKISTEFEKAFSSYAARRSVHPTMQFEHQLARLTFKVVTDDKNARVRPAGDPKLNIQRYEERPYARNEFFHYNNKYYRVKDNINTAMPAEELFPDGNTSIYLDRVNYFSSTKSYAKGDNVLYDNRYYVFNKDYQGAWPEEDPDAVTDKTKSFLKYRTYHTYVFGDVIVVPADDETGEEKIYICPTTIEASQNPNFKSIKSRLLDYQKGVFISKIRIPDVYNKGVISIDKDKISYESTTLEKDTFYLGERDSSIVNHRLPTTPYPKLMTQVINGDTIPVITPTGPTDEAVSVGESMLVTPADSYQLLISTQEYIDSKGNIIGEKSATNDIPAVRIRPESGTFEAGKSYEITIKVTSTQIIEVTAKLSDWNSGGKVEDLDTSGDTDSHVGRLDGHHYFYFGAINNEDSIKHCFDKNSRNFLYKEIPDLTRDSYIFENVYGGYALCHWLLIPEEYEITEIMGTEYMIEQSYMHYLDTNDSTRYAINGEENGFYKLRKIKNGNFRFTESYRVTIEKRAIPSHPEEGENPKQEVTPEPEENPNKEENQGDGGTQE